MTMLATARRKGRLRNGKATTYGPAGTEVTRYESEKRLGLRRETGARKLKRLTTRHLDIIALHIAGWSGEAISAHVGCRPATISRILNDPLSTSLIQVAYGDRISELDALTGQALDTIRDSLKRENTVRERLTGVDKLVKLQQTIGSKGADEVTAEDVIQRMLSSAVFKDCNVQVNLGEKDNGSHRR